MKILRSSFIYQENFGLCPRFKKGGAYQRADGGISDKYFFH